jgi:hypothetical protein
MKTLSKLGALTININKEEGSTKLVSTLSAKKTIKQVFWCSVQHLFTTSQLFRENKNFALNVLLLPYLHTRESGMK